MPRVQTPDQADPQSQADLQGSAEPHLDSVGHFLRASRDEIQSLLARTQEIQGLSSQAVHSLLEQLHARLQKELEASSTSFVGDTRRRVQHTASLALETFGKEASARQAALLDEALARWQAARQDAESTLKEAADDYQKRLAESSTSALEEFRSGGKSLFDGFQIELRKNVEDLQKKGVEDLRRTAGELADEIRRRADAGFETLSGELASSGKTLVEETQKQLATLSQSALDALTQEASETVRQQVGLGISALNQAADQTRANLEGYLQQAIESFQKQIGELTSAALEKNNKTSEFLLHDLRSRLDQAARALQQTLEAEAGGRERFAD